MQTTLITHQPAPATLGQLFWKNRQAWIGQKVTEAGVRYSQRHLEDHDLDGELEAGVTYDVVEARAATPEEIAADRAAREAALPTHERLLRRIDAARPLMTQGQGEAEVLWSGYDWGGTSRSLSVYPNGILELASCDRSGHESWRRLEVGDAERPLIERLREEQAERRAQAAAEGDDEDDDRL